MKQNAKVDKLFTLNAHVRERAKMRKTYRTVQVNKISLFA